MQAIQSHAASWLLASVVVCFASNARAEKAPLTKEELTETATLKVA